MRYIKDQQWHKIIDTSSSGYIYQSQHVSAFGGKCCLSIGAQNIFSGQMCNLCSIRLIQLTTPIILDGYETITISSNKGIYCPWCIDQLRYNRYHDTPIICTECQPKYTAEYDGAVIKYWLMGSLYIPDIARVIMSLMISFFCCIVYEARPKKIITLHLL